MDAVDLLADVVLGPEIPVVSAATLPEAVLATSIWLTVLHARKEGGALVADP